MTELLYCGPEPEQAEASEFCPWWPDSRRSRLGGDQRRPPDSRGVLARWLVADGSRVRLRQPVAEVRTSHGRHRVFAPAAGTLHHQAREGELLVYGYPLGLIE